MALDQPTPDERLDVARNYIGNARLQMQRIGNTPTTRAAIDLIDVAARQLSQVPRFPEVPRGEASVFFEGATLTMAVAMVLEAVLPGDECAPSEAVEAAVSGLVGRFSDRELAELSGQRARPVSQAGLPTQTMAPFNGRRPGNC